VFPKPFDHIVRDGYPPTIEVAIPHQLFSSNNDENTTRIIRPRHNDKGKARDDRTQSSCSLDVIHQAAGRHPSATLSRTPIKHEETSSVLHKLIAEEVQSQLGSI
jgi:hypothetical protein